MHSTFTKAGCAAFVALALLAPQVHAADVEVLHWWTSGGEAKSATELKKMVESKGNKWKDVAVAGGGGDNAATVIKSRIVSGNPPTAAQIKGPSIQEWGAEGVLADIDDVAKAGNWDSLLPPVVANIMKYKGHYVAVPVNVHRVNWMWANPEVFKKAGATIPTTWAEFAVAAEKIQKAGFIPVAHGGQPWQDFTTFESIALGVGGADYYKKAFVQLDDATLKGPTTVKAFETLAVVRKYIDKDSATRDWNLATGMVISGKAAMQFMGDWAKGEFTAAGKVPGKDYVCVAAPGTANAFTFNIDSFVMFDKAGADAKKARGDFASAVMSPEFQEVFNLNKGSIPVRSGVDLSKFDDCAKKSAADFAADAKAGTLLPTIAHKMAVPESTQGAMQDVVTQFFHSSSMTPAEAATKLAAAAKTK
ncbi:ABC transporter substrate-binding protein [Derxia gummosa]|uniref:Probable sugar-binding periplasmic protein n=1 Tax=Derxia gummosa DSM 723 TaxID=1121388 RepID=A0A8B6X624_9BURK|nr:ABC transporter substrate-binding protein [Derxia gummosa]